MELKKWEYCTVFYYAEGEVSYFSVNGTKKVKIEYNEKRDKENPLEPIQKYIAKLGLEGWEPVGIMSGNTQWSNELIFKRPIAE